MTEQTLLSEIKSAADEASIRHHEFMIKTAMEVLRTKALKEWCVSDELVETATQFLVNIFNAATHEVLKKASPENKK